MPNAKLPFFIDNIEMAAYALSKYFIDQGYLTDVKFKDGKYTTIVLKERVVKNIVGTPTVVRATFHLLDDGVGIEVKEVRMKFNVGNVIKETLLFATLLPGIYKRAEATNLKEDVLKRAVIIASKMKIKEKSS